MWFFCLIYWTPLCIFIIPTPLVATKLLEENSYTVTYIQEENAAPIYESENQGESIILMNDSASQEENIIPMNDSTSQNENIIPMQATNLLEENRYNLSYIKEESAIPMYESGNQNENIIPKQATNLLKENSYNVPYIQGESGITMYESENQGEENIILMNDSASQIVSFAENPVNMDISMMKERLKAKIQQAIKEFNVTEQKAEASKGTLRRFSQSSKFTEHLAKASRLSARLSLTRHLEEEALCSNMTSKDSCIAQVDKVFEEISPQCPHLRKECNPMDPYRRLDGLCNNLNHKEMGAAGIALKRFLPNAYDDGKFIPRGGFSPSRLPSARFVSVNLHHGGIFINEKGTTHMTMQFGQLIAHDIVLTSQGEMYCCKIPDELEPSLRRCFNIDITGDPFYSTKNITCHTFTRSDTICANDGPWEQINGNTAFIDSSNVYGSTDDVGLKLRTFIDGLLIVNNNSSLTHPSLPTLKQCGFSVGKLSDLASGDERTILQPLLTSVHILFFNEHNRVATELKKHLKLFLTNQSSAFIDNILFEESRKIVIAEIQNIAYNEYLPTILDKKTRIENHLVLNDSTVYNEEFDPSIRNEFSTVAFRFGHSLVSGHFLPIGHQSWFLKHAYFDFNNFVINQAGKGWLNEVRGAIVQKSSALDLIVDDDLSNFLFENHSKPRGHGEDLVARNIQRGRDHGIPSYNKLRHLCGLQRLINFNRKPEEIDFITWKKLETVYDDVEDIDGYSGGLAEIPKNGSLVGPTFACIIGVQFKLLMYGDRFFFTHTSGSNNVRGLKPKSKETVLKRTLSDIICDNTDFNSTQVNVFKTETTENPKRLCSLRNGLNFDDIAEEITSSLNSKPTQDTIPYSYISELYHEPIQYNIPSSVPHQLDPMETTYKVPLEHFPAIIQPNDTKWEPVSMESSSQPLSTKDSDSESCQNVLTPTYGNWVCPMDKSSKNVCELECDEGYAPYPRSTYPSKDLCFLPLSKQSTGIICSPTVALITGGVFIGTTVELYGSNLHLSLPDLPSFRMGHSLNLVDSTILACGGHTMKPHSSINTCIQMTHNYTWIEYSIMKYHRDMHASVVNHGKLILLGGEESPSTQEIITKSDYIDSLNLMKIKATKYSCAAKISPSEYILTGGIYDPTSATLYNVDSGNIEYLPRMMQARSSHGCSFIKNEQSGMTGIMVAGGSYGGQLGIGDRKWLLNPSMNSTDSTEFFDIKTRLWRSMGSLQLARSGLKMVYINSGLYAMGGFVAEYNLNTVDKFDFDTKTWIYADAMMESSAFPAVVAVPSKIFESVIKYT